MRVPGYQFAQDHPQGEPFDDRVPEVSVEVYRVVVSAALALYVKHIRSAQVSDQPPDGPLSQRHVIGDLSDRTPRMHGDVEQDRPMTGDEVPVVVCMVWSRRHCSSN